MRKPLADLLGKSDISPSSHLPPSSTLLRWGRVAWDSLRHYRSHRPRVEPKQAGCEWTACYCTPLLSFLYKTDNTGSATWTWLWSGAQLSLECCTPEPAFWFASYSASFIYTSVWCNFSSLSIWFCCENVVMLVKCPPKDWHSNYMLSIRILCTYGTI